MQQNLAHVSSLIKKRTTKYPPPCKIVNNIIIGDEAPLFTDCNSFGELLFEKLKNNPHVIGQIDSVTDKRITFSEIKERSVRCALWLKNRGIRSGDIIGVSTHFDYTAPLLGCLFICAHFYPIHHKISIHDCRFLLSLAKPKIVFVNADMVEIMAKAAKEENLIIEFVTFGHAKGFQSFQEIIQKEQDAIGDFRCTPISSLEETALFTLSSGSVGQPKVVMLSHRALINNMLNDTMYATESQKVVMWFATLRWITGIIMVLRSIYFCKTQIITGIFDAEQTCKMIKKYNVEWFAISSGMFATIVKNNLFQKYCLSSLKKVCVGGAAIRSQLLETMIKALPYTEIIHVLGMCELSGTVATQREGDKLGSVGYVLKNVQLKVIDIDTGNTLGPNKVGELLWKSPYMLTGYYNNPEATKETLTNDGWLRSGDLGYYDEDGELYICDRITETIRVDGFMVYPTEIENILQDHPAIREVAVVRIRDDINEERPIAFVSKFPDLEVTIEELIKLVADNLEDYKHLRGGVQFLDELPHTDTGKIARKQLRELAKCFVSNYVTA
ncbi:hypothetical protein P5V15_011250 [Pogonomyrmex californicus]